MRLKSVEKCQKNVFVDTPGAVRNCGEFLRQKRGTSQFLFQLHFCMNISVFLRAGCKGKFQEAYKHLLEFQKHRNDIYVKKSGKSVRFCNKKVRVNVIPMLLEFSERCFSKSRTKRYPVKINSPRASHLKKTRRQAAQTTTVSSFPRRHWAGGPEKSRKKSWSIYILYSFLRYISITLKLEIYNLYINIKYIINIYGKRFFYGFLTSCEGRACALPCAFGACFRGRHRKRCLPGVPLELPPSPLASRNSPSWANAQGENFLAEIFPLGGGFLAKFTVDFRLPMSLANPAGFFPKWSTRAKFWGEFKRKPG